MTSHTISNTYVAAGYNALVTDLTVTATATVAGAGVYSTNSLTLFNNGQIQAGADATGVRLWGGGEVNNHGLISGDTAGISAYGAATAVMNYGIVVAKATAINITDGGQVYNNGLISAYRAVFLDSGSITNLGTMLGLAQVLNGPAHITNGSLADTTALINGRYGVLMADGTVENDGTLIGSSAGVATGLGLSSSLVTNGSSADRTALISGYNGVLLDIGTVQNFGTIIGTGDTGVEIEAAGWIANGTNGDHLALIRGITGVTVAEAASIANYGTISGLAGDGIVGSDGGTVVNGSVTDRTAEVKGYRGIGFSGATGTVSNFGTIEGLGPLGDPAIALTAGGSVTNGNGADTVALVSGVTGVDASLGATVANFGVIDGDTGYGVVLRAGGSVTNGSGLDRAALIQGYIGIDLKAAGTVQNFGTILGTNPSTMEGAYLAAGAVLTNGSASDTTALIDGFTGLDLSGHATNFGTIIGNGGVGSEGATLLGGARLTNGSASLRSALVEGTTGIAVGAGSTVTNWGTIDGLGGTAVSMTGAGTVLVDEAGSVLAGKVVGGGGSLVLAGTGGTLTGLGSTVAGFKLMTVQSGAAWTFGGATSIAHGSTLANLGAVLVTGGVTDNGLIEAEASTLHLAGSVTGSGTLQLTGTATLAVDGAVSSLLDVLFTGKETLKIADPSGFRAQITGFAAGDRIDLSSFASGSGETLSFTPIAGKTAGTLKVTEGSSILNVTLFGQYVASGFKLASDGHSGSVITYTPPGPTHALVAIGH